MYFHRAPCFRPGAPRPSDNHFLLCLLAAGICDCMKSRMGENFKSLGLNPVVICKSNRKDTSVLHPGSPIPATS